MVCPACHGDDLPTLRTGPACGRRMLQLLRMPVLGHGLPKLFRRPGVGQNSSVDDNCAVPLVRKSPRSGHGLTNQGGFSLDLAPFRLFPELQVHQVVAELLNV
jgi:hypothetical protein